MTLRDARGVWEVRGYMFSFDDYYWGSLLLCLVWNELVLER